MSKRIYVLQSEDEKIVKLGQTSYLTPRIDQINYEQSEKYILLYLSKELDPDIAKFIEGETIDHFKDYCIKGREWFEIEVKKIIDYFHNRINIPKKREELDSIKNLCNYDFWVENNSKHSNKDGDDIIKTYTSSYTYSVQLLFNSRILTIGFCNLGDANRVVRHFKYHIEALKYITQRMYGLSLDDWKKQKILEKKLQNWVFN